MLEYFVTDILCSDTDNVFSFCTDLLKSVSTSHFLLLLLLMILQKCIDYIELICAGLTISDFS